MSLSENYRFSEYFIFIITKFGELFFHCDDKSSVLFLFSNSFRLKYKFVCWN